MNGMETIKISDIVDDHNPMSPFVIRTCYGLKAFLSSSVPLIVLYYYLASNTICNLIKEPELSTVLIFYIVPVKYQHAYEVYTDRRDVIVIKNIILGKTWI